jgi:hypothetical protein
MESDRIFFESKTASQLKNLEGDRWKIFNDGKFFEIFFGLFF